MTVDQDLKAARGLIDSARIDPKLLVETIEALIDAVERLNTETLKVNEAMAQLLKEHMVLESVVADSLGVRPGPPRKPKATKATKKAPAKKAPAKKAPAKKATKKAPAKKAS